MSLRTRSSSARSTAARLLVAATLATVSVGLTGCSAPDGPPTVQAEFSPDGRASENRDYFDQVSRATIVANPDATGEDMLDALADAGFDRSQLQTSVDGRRGSDAVNFSVLMRGVCLIGRNSVKEGGYTSHFASPLRDGSCLPGAS